MQITVLHIYNELNAQFKFKSNLCIDNKQHRLPGIIYL